MKRDGNLHPLSWEHHTGLVIARRIRRSLASNADIDTIATYVSSMWCEHLHPHFETEENLLVPLMERHGGDHALTQRLKEEHTCFRKWVQQIRSAPDSDLLSRFAEALTAHIRFEEGEVFPHAEDLIPQDALRSLGEQLRDHYTKGSA